MREVAPRSPFALLLLLIVLAYAGVLVIAPIWAITDGAIERGKEPVLATLEDPGFQHAIQLTVKLSLVAAVLNTVFGVVIAWVLARHRFYGSRILDALVDIPFVFSPVIAGFTMIVLFGRNGWLEPSTFAIVFAWPAMLLAKTFVALPFVTREVQPVLESLAIEPEEAAYTLGASRFSTFWRIVLPAIWLGVLYGVVLTIARAVGEFGAVAVVSGGIEGKTETATMYVFRALQDRNRIGAYTTSLLLGGFSVAILLVMTLVRYRLTRTKD